MPAYTGSIPREEDFLRDVPRRIQDLIDEKNEVVVLVAFEKSPAGIYKYRIYKSNSKEAFFSSDLHHVGHNLAAKGYTVYVYAEYPEIKKYTYEEFLKTR